MSKQERQDMNKFDDRKNRQEAEGYEEVKSDLPEKRFQGKKQVAKPDQLSVDKSAISDPAGAPTDPVSTAAKTLKSKIKIKPEVSVDELEGKQVGGVPLVGAMTLQSVAGVSAQSPVDDMSKIPYSKGGYRPESRFGKKRSEDLFMLDNQVAEQVIPNVEDSLDLREAPDAKQGYNGRKQFKQTRGKKNFAFTSHDGTTFGKLPQQLLNDTSVDFVHTSKRIYTSGQMITGKYNAPGYRIPIGADYPTKRHDGSAVPNVMHKGNYDLQALDITVENGLIKNIQFVEEGHVSHADPTTRDQSNMNLQVDANNITKSMIRLQNELGRETTDKWSPLGYVINEGYEYNTICHDIEAMTGSIMATAYRAAVSSMAFQRNIAGKDGVNPQRNAIKMIVEGYKGPFANSDTGAITDTDFKHVIFNKKAYREGSVAGLIEMFDSISKYRTKADLLGLQRSLSLHLSQCDNNLDPLHVKPNFLKVLDKAHMFSTVDGKYNPFLPIYSTRTIKLVNPMPLNVFLQNWKNPALLTDEERRDVFRDITTGTYANYSYSYNDIRRNEYVTRVQHPLVEGLLKWLLNHEGAFCNTFGKSDGSATLIHIPATFNFEAPSLFEFMLCSAAQDVLFERNIIFRDILFAGEQSTYVWDDLSGLDSLDPLYSTQLKINRYDEPLTLGKLADDTVVRELWSDMMQMTAKQKANLVPVRHGMAQYMLPWYFNEVAFGTTAGGSHTYNEGFTVEERAFNMSIPSIRDGVRHEYVDVIKSMDERSIRLSLDRKTAIPVFSSIYETVAGVTIYHNYNTSNVLSDNIKLSTIRYDNNSDGRMVVRYDLTDGDNRSIDVHSLYCCPKELGWIDDDLDRFNVVNTVGFNDGDVVVDTTLLLNSEQLGLADNSYAYNGFSPMFLTSYRVAADSPQNGAIDRSAALSQVFFNCFASDTAADIDDDYVLKTGVYPALSYNDGDPIDVPAIFNVGSDHESTYTLDGTIRTLAPRIWTMLQRFYLPMNRFENVFSINKNVDYDPFEESYYFGLCGFLASDYTQDVLERLDIYDQLGLDYIEDTFVKDSLIFR